jgi:trehalose 6-phosphate phosphatase
MTPAAQSTPPFARDWCFFLDIDGTLVEFAERPDAVLIDAGLKTLLRRLRRAARGAVALISGRAVADIDHLFAPLRFAAAGQHGIERRDEVGELQIHAAPAAKLGEAADHLKRLVAKYPGLVFENKGTTLAMHYRLAPHLEAQVVASMAEQCRLLGGGFELLTGKMLLEIKPGGKHKGTAIAEFMQEPPFRKRLPVFIGDDATDEYGFALVNSLQGHAVKVGAGPTAANWRLADAANVRAWLKAYADRYAPLAQS